jgi:multidrug efflux pump subunit AcrA (membrane-fusion protein)
MKTPVVVTLLALVATALAGCDRAPDKHARAAVVPAATYRPGHGLQLSPMGRDFVGLTVAEFKERVPRDAVLRTVQGDFVYVENGDWLLRTPIKLAPREGEQDSLVPSEGLYDGDRIVTRGVRALWLAELHFLRAGQACTHGGG